MKVNIAVIALCVLSLSLPGCASAAGPGRATASQSVQTAAIAADPAPGADLAAQIAAITSKNRAPFRVAIGADNFRVFEKMLTHGLNAPQDERLAQRVKADGLTEYREMPPSFSLEDAAADVDFLFDYLKYGYSGYGYFGGDEVFLPVKESIRKELDAMAAQSPEKRLTGEQFVSVLSRSLVDVISDGHFSLGGIQLLRANVFCYLSGDLLFGKDKQGYFLLRDGAAPPDGERVYFAGMSEDQIQALSSFGLKQDVSQALLKGDYDSFIKPTIGKDGSIAYAICMSSVKTHDSIDMTIRLKGAGGAASRDISLNRVRYERYLSEMNRQLFEENKMYRTDTREGVKIVEIRSFYSPSGGDTAQLDQFVREAEGLRGEDYLILDLRRNGGGNSLYPVEWFKAFTQSEGAGLGITSTLLTKTVRATIPESYGPEAMADFDRRSAKSTVPGWERIEVSGPSRAVPPIPNETKVFVITDLAVASAGENFVAFLQNLDNVCFVGTNTWGVSMFGNVRPLYLPRTAVEVNASYNISVLPDMSRFEGEGFQPDLWVDTNDAVDLTLKLIANLKSQRGVPD